MFSQTQPQPQSVAPNILYIMADDHATNAISAYAGTFATVAPTPNIDRIANDGIRLDNCHCCNSICTPSRASILTGQHSHVNDVRTLSTPLPATARLLPEMLQEAGYQTAIFGKWHLHCRPRGFDDWAVLPGQGLYFNPFFLYPDKKAVPNNAEPANIADLHAWERADAKDCTLARAPGYVTDVITDKTLDWLMNQRDTSRPFFLCCQHKAPHDPFEFTNELAEYLADVELPEPETLFENENALQEISRKYGSTMSERWKPRNAVEHLKNGFIPQYGPVDFSNPDPDARTRKAYQLYNKAYLRAVRSIDDNVGRLLDYLDETGLTENTLVIYTSDQGMMLGEHDKIDKRWIFDESQRMPFLARLPGCIPPGTTSEALVDNTDFAPTLLELAGLDAPTDMQGISFLQTLKHPETKGKNAVYYRYWMHMAHHWVPAHYGIRTQNYKLVFFYGMKLDAPGCPENGRWSNDSEPGLELYDLQNDPLETTNQINNPEYAIIADKLKKQLLELKQTLGDTDEKYPALLKLQAQFLNSPHTPHDRP